MSATALLPQPDTVVDPRLGSTLASSHDRWMAECDRALGPITEPDATWLQRWGAMRFVTEQLPERCRLEQELVSELEPFLQGSLNDRLQNQAKLVHQLRQEVERLAFDRCTARDLARRTLDLVQALRIWYAETEFAIGEVQPTQISVKASRILNQLKP